MRPDLTAILLASLLAGCASLPGPREPAPDPVAITEAVQAAQLRNHLQALLTLVTGTPTQQAEVVAAARQRFEDARDGGPAVLHLGLVLAAPVHPARDPETGQQLLREALARPELLSNGERSLAVVELERVSAELRLGTENQRLVTDLQQERERTRVASSSPALTRQLQVAQEEIARLRRDLQDARTKLDAIAEFERRQADRPPASEVRNP